MKYEYYPPQETWSKNQDIPLYYVEFTDWEDGKSIHWKLYKRNFPFTHEKVQGTEDRFIIMSREGHPYSLIEDNLLPDGCTPDKKWLFFMVDALNEKVYNDFIKLENERMWNCSNDV